MVYYYVILHLSRKDKTSSKFVKWQENMGRGRKIWQVAGKLIAIVKYEKRKEI